MKRPRVIRLIENVAYMKASNTDQDRTSPLAFRTNSVAVLICTLLCKSSLCPRFFGDGPMEFFLNLQIQSFQRSPLFNKLPPSSIKIIPPMIHPVVSIYVPILFGLSSTTAPCNIPCSYILPGLMHSVRL